MEGGKKRKAAAAAAAAAEEAESVRPISFYVPVGFTFNPTDVELVTYYLPAMLRSENVPQAFIHHANVYAFHPQKLTETYAPARESNWYSRESNWYFFTPREAKYPKGNRPNRKADNGYWKTTGSKKITHQGQVVGRKTSLVFHHTQGDSNYRNATKTNWIMHEYVSDGQHEKAQFDSWVLCRIHKHGKEKQSAVGPSQLVSFDGPSPLISQVPTQTTSFDYNIMSSITSTSSTTDSPTTNTNDCSYYDEPSTDLLWDYVLAPIDLPTKEPALVPTDGPSYDHFLDQPWDYHFTVPALTSLPIDEPELESTLVPTGAPSNSFTPSVPLARMDVTTTTDSDRNHMLQPGDAATNHPLSTSLPPWLRGSWEEFDDKYLSDLLDDLDY